MLKNRYHITDETFASFADKYPNVKRSDIEELITQEIYVTKAELTQRSEIEFLKNKAIIAMGTEHEMKFSDIEMGMLRASLSDGRQALKEIIGKTPVEAPSCSDGTKMKDQGSKKKNIMTTLGLIEGIGRTLYRDEVEHINVYPLDKKIELLEIGGRHSRYTSNFSRLAGDYYARLPERDVLALLKKTLGIDLEKDSLTAIGAVVAQPYLPPRFDEEGVDVVLQKDVVSGPGFIEKRIQEIDASPNRDEIIHEALIGNMDGNERRHVTAALSAAYVLADGTGIFGLPGELSDKGKNGGVAKTFEAKIGVFFTQNFNADGLPLLANGSIYRNPDSTRYMGTVEKIDQFTPQMERFAMVNGIESANQTVFLSDGAVWLENLRKKLFPNSVGIIDFYHASQHLHKLVDSLLFYSKQNKAMFFEKCYKLLELGMIDKMVDLIEQKTTDSNRESVNKQLPYFTGNKDKMRYGLFRSVGLFIGSGVVEAGCKTIVENRLNCSGMRWSKKNAANVIALRCSIYSGFYDSAAA